jgi:asparagine synthase (glutamine-hydrolysing)
MMSAEIELYLQTTLLPDSDAFSMTHSVELRVPFLDPQVYAALLLHAEDRGHIDKHAFASLLADPHLIALTQRKKTGFSMPMTEWMATGPLRPTVARTMDAAAPVWDVVDREAALPIFDSARWAEPWALVALNGWLETVAPARAAA